MSEKLESIYKVMSEDMYEILKISSIHESFPNLRFTDFLSDSYESGYSSYIERTKFLPSYQQNSYNRALFNFSFNDNSKVLENFSDNAIKELFEATLSLMMDTTSKIRENVVLKGNELIPQSAIDETKKMDDSSHPLYKLKKNIKERLDSYYRNEDLSSGYKYVFKNSVICNLFSEMKKRKLFHDNSFKTGENGSSLKLITEDTSTFLNYAANIKISNSDIEDAILPIAELNLWQQKKKLQEAVKEDKNTAQINTIITKLGIILAPVWVGAKKYKSKEMLDWLNDSMQSVLDIISEIGDRNVIVNQKCLNIINKSIYKHSLKSDFAKDYFFVKKINEIQEKWKTERDFPLDIVDGATEFDLVKKLYGKTTPIREGEINCLRINRDEFKYFYLSKGMNPPDENSTNKLFLSGFSERLKKEKDVEVSFRKSLEDVKSGQNIDYFYIMLPNRNNKPKEDFDAYSKIFFREIVDCNKMRAISFQKIENDYDEYLMKKDLANSVVKKDEVNVTRKIRKF